MQRAPRSAALEGVIVDLRPPASVRRLARRMARPALRRGVDLGHNTWAAIVLQLWDAKRAGQLR